MRLLDLPPEVFEKVVAALVRVAPFHDLIRLRAVCRTFAGDIDNQLLAEMSVADFHSRTLQHQSSPARPLLLNSRDVLLGRGDDGDGSFDSLDTLSPDIKGHLLRNIKTYLLNHIEDREMMDSELPSFINRVADKLLEFRPAGTVLRKDYLSALICSLVLTNEVAPQTMFDKISMQKTISIIGVRTGPRSVLGRERHHITFREENFNDMLAAAAAVGDLVATRHYIAQSAEVIDWFPKYFVGFGNPLIAAACNGNIEVLEYLLMEANNELKKRNFLSSQHNRNNRCGPLTENITSAIRYAVRTGETEAVATLFAFLPRCHVGIPLHMKCPSHYLADAMRWGQMDLFTWLMDRFNFSRAHPSYHATLIAGLRLAIEHGHIHIVRYVFENCLVNPCDADADTVLISAKHGHRAIIQLALDRGAQLSMDHLVSALNGTLPVLMTQFLLLHSVPLTTTTKDKHGKLITTYITPTVEMLCQESIHVPFGDRNPVRGKEKILALILLAREMRQQIPELMLDNCTELKKLFHRLVRGCMILPKGSVPYLNMVSELYGWMKWGDGRDGADCNV